MNKQELFDSLKFLFEGQEAVGLNMYMIMKNKEGILTRKADLDQPVIDELKNKFLTRLMSQCGLDSKVAFLELSKAQDKRNTIYHYDFDEKPKGIEILGELLKNENVKDFNFFKDVFKDINGFVFLIGNADNKIAIYKKMYPISLIQRDSVLMIRKVQTRLVKLDEDILKINDDYDLIQVGDDLIVINLLTLERFFGFEEIIRRQAENNLQMIDDSGILEDVSPLKAMSLQIKYAKKIVLLKRESPVLKLPFNRIKDFVKMHPKLRNRLRFNRLETKIALDTIKSKELFLKLLDDDFLKSELTDLLYESEIKDPLTNEEESD